MQQYSFSAEMVALSPIPPSKGRYAEPPQRKRKRELLKVY
jgi:hypothetical protein